MGKIAPSHRLREELREFLEHLEGVEDGKGALSELVRRAVGLIVQESLEAEKRDFIGRERYERGEGQGLSEWLHPRAPGDGGGSGRGGAAAGPGCGSEVSLGAV